MKVGVGDKIATDMTNDGTILFIGKEWVIYTDGEIEYCSNKNDCGFWIPAEIEWEESIKK